MVHHNRSAFVAFAVALQVSTTIPAFAKAPVLAPVDFSACADLSVTTGSPVGVTAGNALTKDSGLTFTLLDPAKGNNVWVGGASSALTITLSVASPKAVYLLMNTLYGQPNVANATITFSGTGQVQKAAALVGNKSIRDYNNGTTTNIINGTTSQEWWTNNLNPKPNDQSHRIDAHVFSIGPAFSGQTLTKVEIKAPKTAGINVMLPMLFAVGVEYPGAGSPIRRLAIKR